MGKFQYEWWTVDVREATGIYTWEVKARSRDNAIKQVEKMADTYNKEIQVARPDFAAEIFWKTLTLDRTGFQRRF